MILREALEVVATGWDLYGVGFAQFCFLLSLHLARRIVMGDYLQNEWNLMEIDREYTLVGMFIH